MPQGSRFVCFNGHFFKEDSFRIEAQNRAFKYADGFFAFKYADGFFETMHYAFGEVQLYQEHLKRMALALDTLKIESVILRSPDILHSEIEHLNNANHYFKGARVRISVFRSGGGLYTPESNEASYLIESSPLNGDNYPLNKEGIHMGVYSEIPKPKSIFNRFKMMASPVPILASIDKGGNHDVFLVNEDNAIVESTHSNAFFIKDEVIYTPSLGSGCLHGIMREQVFKLCDKYSLQIEETDTIQEKDLPFFDEIFLTNAIRGVQWVGAYKNKRFDNKRSKEIAQLLVKQIL